MKDIISKLKSLGSKSQETLFQRIFLPIRKSHPELAKELAAFCATGEPAEALIRAERTVVPDAENAFDLITGSHAYWMSRRKDSSGSRRDAYRQFASGDLAPESVVRMGKSLAALVKTSGIQKHTHPGFPDWLYLVLIDWLVACCNRPEGLKALGAKTTPQPDAKALAALCEADNLHTAEWLHFFFDRQGAGGYWNFQEKISTMREFSGLKEFVAANRDHVVSEIAPKLSAAGMAQCLIEIEKLDCAEQFEDFVADHAVSDRKTVQCEAVRILARFPEDRVRDRLARFLLEGRAGERKLAAEVVGRFMGEKGRALLDSARRNESSSQVVAAIDMALGAVAMREESTDEAPLSIPEYKPPVLDSLVDTSLIDRIEAQIRELQAKYKDMKVEYPWQKEEKKRILGASRKDAEHIVGLMNGQAKPKYDWHRIARYLDARFWEDGSIDLIHVMRLYGKPPGPREHYRSLEYGPLSLWLKRQVGKLSDLRALADVLAALGWPDDFLEREILLARWGRPFLLRELPPDRVWPYFAERLEPLAEALSNKGVQRNRWEEVSLDRVLEVLAMFPVLPGAVKAPLLQLALGEGKTYRVRAQALLENVPGIEGKVAAALKSNTQEARMNAAAWLGRIGAPGAVGPLKAALAKESREPVRATFLSALEALGEDISELLHPDLLLKEARTGLKKSMPKGLEWFPFDGMPGLKWRDGSSVDRDVPKWWLVLACKLKDPGGNELVWKYLQRLDETSRQALGMYVLRAFIAQDAIGPAVEEAEEKASQQAPGLLNTWKYYAKYEWGAAFRERTLEDAHAEIRRQILGTYLGTAIREKGILALCAYAPGAEAVPLVRAYMKDHYTRRHQIEAILRAIAPGGDSHVVQLLLSAARRHRTRSVQDAAAELVETIAERNGWTREELADRTMPTAGFDENGQMVFDYGSRRFTATLSDNLTPLLTSEDGKSVKALPAARKSDDDEMAKEAKKAFGACKKELKQVVQTTAGRLYEAMCAARKWPAGDWTEFLHAHPIASRLIQRLIWIHEENGPRACFRPAEDGALLTAEDDEIEAPRSGTVCLAHRSILSDAEAAAWRAHLKDYKVKPLFEQIDRPALPDNIDMAKTGIDTYEGYASDSFTLRGVLTKLGYQRGAAEDGGFFHYYTKYFESANLQAIIFFTGNCLPEENVPAALRHMGFCARQESGWFNEQDMRQLKNVPPILLSEVMADYKAAADKTGGYDPDWEKKAAW